MYDTSIAESAASKADKLPRPVGPYILVALPPVEEKTTGGIYRPDQLKEREGTATIFGYVVSIGSDAYTDSGRFPTGPRCSVGDWVMFRSYSGTRFKYDGQEYRVMFDDSVEAVVVDPSKFERV
jgi:chaperonin GroES